jgi:hypothetical protein
VAFKVLHLAFMLLGGSAGTECAKIAPFAGFGVGFSGIEAITAGIEFADHGNLLCETSSKMNTLQLN